MAAKIPTILDFAKIQIYVEMDIFARVLNMNWNAWTVTWRALTPYVSLKVIFLDLLVYN